MADLVPDIAGAPLEPAPDPYDVALVNLDRSRGQAARANIMAGGDADLTAKALPIARDLNAPVDTVERNLADFERISRSRQYGKILDASPNLARWMSNPINARVTGNDLPKLAGTESLWTNIADLGRSLPAGALKGIGTILSGTGELYNVATSTMRNVLKDTTGIESLTGGVGLPWFADPAEIVGRPGKNIKSVGAAVGAPPERQWLGTEVIEGVGQIGAQIAAVVATGGTVGFAMLLAQGADQMAEEVEKAGKTGTYTGNATVIAGGLVTGLLEKTGIDLILDRVPPAIKNNIVRKITDLAIAGGIEAAQEAVEKVAQNALANYYLNTDKSLTEGVIDEATPAGIAAALVRAMVGARGRPNTKQPEADAALLERMLAAVKDTDLAKRSPEKMAEFLGGLPGGDRNAYVPADAVRSYFQNLEPEAAAKLVETLGIGGQLEQALATGGDVVIPLNQYVAHAPDDMVAAWQDEIRLRASGMSRREAREYEAGDEARAKELGASIAKRAEEEIRLDRARNEVVTRVERMMQAAGESPETARQIATLYGERYLARAARSGLSADDAVKAFARSGLDVQSDLFPASEPVDVPEIADAIAEAQAIVAGEKAAEKAKAKSKQSASGEPLAPLTPAAPAPDTEKPPASNPIKGGINEAPPKRPFAGSVGAPDQDMAIMEAVSKSGDAESLQDAIYAVEDRSKEGPQGPEYDSERWKKVAEYGRALQKFYGLEAAEAPVTGTPGIDQWNALTPAGRRDAMERAGVKLPDRVMWENMSEANRAKLRPVLSPAAPLAPAAAPAPTVTKPTAPPAKRDGQTPIGRNKDGKMLYEDERGVRSYLDSGVRISEPVSFKPGSNEISVSRARPEYLVAEPHPDRPDITVEYEKPAASVEDTFDRVTSIPTRTGEKAFGKFKGFASTNNGGFLSVHAFGDTAEEAQNNAAERLKTKVEEREVKRAGQNIAAAPTPVPPAAPDRFAGNKLFTSDKVEAARARLRSKLRNQLNSGFDPEVMLDGITITGAYIEAGVRDFASYAKAMTEDMGDAIRPYLLSFYEGVRNYPGLDTEGMTPPAEAALLHADYTKNNVDPNSGEDQANADNREDSGESDTGEGSRGIPAPDGERDVGTDATAASGDSRAESGGRDGAGDGRIEPAGQPELPAGPMEAGAGVRGEGPDSAGDGVGAGDRGDRQLQPDYRYQPGELTRDRSWKGVAERNIQAVELAKKLTEEGRQPTADERALLARFTGWGASEIANGVFPDPRTGQFKAGWQDLGERLRAALSDDEYVAARRSTQYAHYTSEGVIRSIYGALGRLGFGGGRILEPGMGIGLFRGLMPDGIAANSRYHGIEYDPITGAIAKALYPQSRIQVGDFTEIALPKDYYDAAIGNPPFSSSKVLNDPEYRSRAFMLHDYFFAKTIDRVKPGGLVVFVTSKGTMDKGSDRARKYMADRADLLGAIRLPQTAFKDNAGTEVVTDVLFLQRRAPGAEAAGESWLGTKEVETPQGPTPINEYFANHPEMVLGTHALTGSMYRSNEYTVIPRAGDIEQQFSEAIQNLPENIYRPVRGSAAERSAVLARDFDPKAKKEGSVYVDDAGQLRIVDQGSGAALIERTNTANKSFPLKPKEVQFLKDYVGLRDVLKQAQYDQINDGPWEASLKALNRAYTAFVRVHGNILAHTTTERPNDDGTTTVITRWKNNALLRIDAENALVRALEEVRQDGTIVPGKILTGRTMNKPTAPVVNTVQDALLVQLNQQGSLDMGAVARIAGITEADAIEQLGEAIYNDPSFGWTTADAYLSGNVVRKLKEAREAARTDPKLNRNVSALEAVQPAPLAPADITARLGAHWIPASDVAAFAAEVIGERMSVTYSPLVKVWNVEGGGGVSEWNPAGITAPELLEKALNGKEIKISQRVSDGNGGTTTVVDPEATEAANSVAKKMDERFRSWIWSSPQRTQRLARFYNEHFNNIVPRSFDGRHLTLPGISSRFDLYPHQKAAIWRAIQDGNTYLAHAVGAGKTFTMIAAGMEERRLGLVKKPMYVVPNHMLSQFAREFQELYPTAHIMVADEESFHTSNRQQFVARAALNDPDAIIITHSAFGRISISEEFNDRYVQSLIDEYLAMKEEVEGDRVTIKQIERRLEALERKLSGKTDQSKKDKALTFEELGVDRLYVDEFHEFRKLDFPTNRGNVKGIDPSGSQRSMDMHMKLQYLEEKNPNRSLVAASGTPVTNTMGELFTAQRFLQPAQLKEDGLDGFDAWANQFGEVVSGFEQNPSGGYDVVARFARFVNVPDLMRRVRSFMDVLTSDQLSGLVQRPTVDGGGREIVVTPVPDGYSEYQKKLEARIRAIRERRGPPKKGDDIILSVISDGRFSAIDMRFVDRESPSDPNSKLNRMLDDVIEAYRNTADWEYHTGGTPDKQRGAASMVFTDIGLGEASAENRGFDMKDWIVKRLVDGGVAPDHIAFMRDHKSHAKKEKLFSDMRQGNKRILIGGKDMETGVNAQKRLTHLFHLDSPWFPASIEQREGRIVRQGNQNKTVTIRAYATKGSYDSTMWGMNARKQRFITQALQGNESTRAMDDVSEASSFEMASALASGDERYLKVAGLRSDVDRLGRLFSAHEREQSGIRSKLARNEQYFNSKVALIEQIESAIARRPEVAGVDFAEIATVDGAAVENRDDFGNKLFAAFKGLAEANTEGSRSIGQIGGLDIIYSGVAMKGSGDFVASADLDLPGDKTALIVYPIDPAASVKGIAARAVNQIVGLDADLGYAMQNRDKAVRETEQLQSRLGASFPELAELVEKRSNLEALEAELAAESAAANAAQDAAQPDAAVGVTEGDGRTYNQAPDGGGLIRGNITFTQTAAGEMRSVMTLLKDRNLSTVLHETGHLWLEELHVDAANPNAPAELKADLQKVRDYLGAKGNEPITVEQHEKWARTVEAYLMEGKSPSIALSEPFARFKSWLKSVYRTVLKLNVEINDDMRGVLDRMIATDEAIAEAKTEIGARRLFASADQAGMTEAEFKAYTDSVTRTQDRAEQAVLDKLMAEVKARRTAEWKEEASALRAEVAGMVDSEPAMRAFNYLRGAALPESLAHLAGMPRMRIAREDLAEYGNPVLPKSVPPIDTDKNGSPVADIAEVLGFADGRAMIDALTGFAKEQAALKEAGDKRSVRVSRINAEVERIMAERHGDMLNDGSIEAEALSALHNEARSDVLAAEVRALARQTGKPATPFQMARQWAKRAIAEKAIPEVMDLSAYTRAEAKAARLAEQAMIKGDADEALRRKQEQMIAHALWIEARDAKEEIEAGRKRMDRLAGARTIKSMDQDYLEKIHALLERFGLKAPSPRAVTESLRAWADTQIAAGVDIAIPDRLLDEGWRADYDKLTVEEFRGLSDSVKQLAHLGRLAKKIEVDGEKREFEETIEEALATVAATPQRGVSGDDTGLTPLQEKLGKVVSGLRSADASLLKMETLLEWLDGDKTGRGIFTRTVFKRIAAAQGRESDRMKGLTNELAAIYAKVPQDQRDRWLDVHSLPGLQKPDGTSKWNKTSIISMALNIGNEGNLDKLLRGYKWDEQTLRDTLNQRLTREEWRFVQDVWDLIETQWPDLAAVHRRVNGVEPPKIERVPVPTPFGVLPGGYYKAAYDRNLSIPAEKIGEKQDTAVAVGQIFPSGMTRPSTRAGATHERTGFAAPIRLSLDLIDQQLKDAAHDIEFREAVLDAHKFLNDNRIRQAIREAVGPEYERQFAPWLHNIAHEWQTDRDGLSFVNRFANVARTNVTIVALGLRISTAMAQVAGFANSVQRLGVVHMAEGLKTFSLAPLQQTAFVREKSAEMRNRANSLERDMRAAQLRFQGKSGALNDIRQLAFEGIALMDAAVSIPTWLGAYSKGLKEGMTDDEAIYYGDKMVRDTQGAGAAKDLAAIQNRGPILKLFTMFYSYFNVLYNRQRGIVRDAREGHWGSAINQSFFLLLAAPLLGSLLTGQGPEDDEEWATWAARNAAFGLFAGIPWVRDISFAASTAVGGKYYGGAKLSPVESFGNNLLHMAKDGVKLASGEEASSGALKNTFNVVGVLTALPLGQVGQTSQFVWDTMIAGSQQPETLGDWLKGLVFGPERK